MKRLTLLVLVFVVGGVAAFGFLGGGAFLADRLISLWMPDSIFPRCTDDEERFASVLGRLGVLDARPVGAEPYGRRGEGCDGDSRIMYAERSYRLSTSRAGVLSFYREAAAKDGWKPAPVPERWEATTEICLTKVIDGRNVYLSFWYYGGPEGKKYGDYFLKAGSEPGGGNVC
ncbi:hypothetical protein ACFQ08_23265 [Streptosporangium algeriense]|uniref:Uncharacterized protein n=1 Tax=Streptosporangium algeriense TaxID=1682748 RepID=A0ABW3DUF5_9ACTN